MSGPADASPPQPDARKVFVVDDHPLLRKGLTGLIEDDPSMVVCGEAASVTAALREIERVAPHVVVADLSLEGADGLELVKQLRASRPELPVLVLSMHDETLHAERSLRAGARGYVMKHEPPVAVLDAIRRVLDGEVVLSRRMSARILERSVGDRHHGETDPLATLSDREFQVLDQIGRGRRTGEIAEALHLSVKTIETYRSHLKDKLGLANAGELVRFAVTWVENG